MSGFAVRTEKQDNQELMAEALSCAYALADLDAALHSMDFKNIQRKVAASMAKQSRLLQLFAQMQYGAEVPSEPVALYQTLKELAEQADAAQRRPGAA